MSTTYQIDGDVAKMGQRFADAWNGAVIDAQVATPSNTAPPPESLKDVQELASPEIEKIEADIKSGTLTEEQAKPLLLEAGLRAVRERLVDAGGQAPGMEPVARR